MADTGVTVEFDVPATMRDGVVLRANVYRPSTGGPWPVLLTRLPYDKNASLYAALIDPLAACRRGFMVVAQDTRGRFASDGEWLPMRFEQEDGYDTVRWAAALPGSNGAVGMFGASYLGNTQWMAAVTKPPELKAIAPAVTWAEPLDGMMARGGAAEFGLIGQWPVVQGMNWLTRQYAGDPREMAARMRALVTDYDQFAERTYWELPAGHLPVHVRSGVPGLPSTPAELAERSEFCRVAGRYDQIEAASFNIGGWYDIFSQGTLDNYVAMTAAGRASRLVMGPWSHVGLGQHQVGQVNFGFGANQMMLDLKRPLQDIQLDWFGHWLAGGPDAVVEAPAGPPVRIFVMGINQWRDEPAWPLERAVETPFYFGPGGTLTSAGPTDKPGVDRYVADPADPVPTIGGATLMTTEFPTGPIDQAAIERRADVLTYTTEPLPADLEVTGRIRVKLSAATSAPSTDWVARLCDVDANGVSRNITDGITRVTGEPGEVAEHEIDLWSTSNVFAAGHRIRVQITSSSFPRWDRNPQTGESAATATELRSARQAVHFGADSPSRIDLPVIPS